EDGGVVDAVDRGLGKDDALDAERRVQVPEVGEGGIRRVVAARRRQGVARLEDVHVRVDRPFRQRAARPAGVAVRRQAVPDGIHWLYNSSEEENMKRRDFVLRSAAGAAALASPWLGAQEAYPSHPVTVINPFPP